MDPDTTLSHAEFVSRNVGKLPPDAHVFTFGKYEGDVQAHNSLTFHQNALPSPQSVQELINSLYK